jgi:hypothetical protein
VIREGKGRREGREGGRKRFWPSRHEVVSLLQQRRHRGLNSTHRKAAVGEEHGPSCHAVRRGARASKGGGAWRFWFEGVGALSLSLAFQNALSQIHVACVLGDLEGWKGVGRVCALCRRMEESSQTKGTWVFEWRATTSCRGRQGVLNHRAAGRRPPEQNERPAEPRAAVPADTVRVNVNTALSPRL